MTIALGCVVSAAMAPRCRKGWSESAQPARRPSSAHEKAADRASTTRLVCSSTLALLSVVGVRESEAAPFIHRTIPPQPTQVTKDEQPCSNRSRRADQDLGQLVTRTLTVNASALRRAASKIDANMLPPLRHDFEVCQLRMARKVMPPEVLIVLEQCRETLRLLEGPAALDSLAADLVKHLLQLLEGRRLTLPFLKR
ncbi:hypothetical protein [Pseudorhodoferax aquiterrae]|uniref:hypothetical protein n=1 Tax=Pseudorhodoferax aquiterrae TaxID=747304 RepID=UPI001678C719|nr:hypothetical protein [Pseudorhodoferax aquiterrae]